MITDPEGPIVILSSGQTLKVESIKLYDADKVNQTAMLKAAAMQNMGGVSTGIGFWGSPAWAIGGAAVLGLVEGMLSNASKKAAIKQLKIAQDTYREMIYGAKFFPVKNIQNLHSPHPQSWAALQTTPSKRFVHDGDEFIDVGTDLGGLSVRWSQVVAYYPPQPKPTRRTAATIAITDETPRSGSSPVPIAGWRPPEGNHMVECRNCGRKLLTGTRVCPDCNYPLPIQGS